MSLEPSAAADNPFYRRKPMSAETRAKIAAALKGNGNGRGRKVSTATRAKLSAAMRGNLNSLGRKESAETRAKKSAARKGKPNANKGKTWIEIMVSSARRLKSANKARVAKRALDELQARGVEIVVPTVAGMRGLAPDYGRDRVVFYHDGLRT